MVRASDPDAPCFLVAAITTSTRLLSNKEADIVVGMIRGMKAPRT
jgi:hypothetical protein